MDRTLITGGSGLLGLNWAAAIRYKCEVYLGCYSRDVLLAGTVSSPINLDTVESALRSLGLLQPDLVIHTAGLTSVEVCEANPSFAQHHNVTLALNVAEACKRLNIKLVHISTDHLFEGASSFYDENATPNPRNTYAESKAEAELQVLATYPNSLIIRTNFYGWGTSYRRSFSDYILRSLRLGIPVDLFEDVFYTPILAESLAVRAMQLLEKNESGIFNIVSDKRISKADFGAKLAIEFGLDKNLIKPVKLASRPDLVVRPLDMSLSNRKVSSVLGSISDSLESDLKRLRQQEGMGLAKELGVL